MYKRKNKNTKKIIPNIFWYNKEINSGAIIKGIRKIVTKLLLNARCRFFKNLKINECKCFASAVKGLFFSNNFFLIKENKSSVEG